MTEMDDAEARVEHLKSAVDSRAPKGECPFCDNTEWSAVVPTADIPVSGPAGGRGSFEAFVARCTHCGFLRFHDAGVVEG